LPPDDPKNKNWMMMIIVFAMVIIVMQLVMRPRGPQNGSGGDGTAKSGTDSGAAKPRAEAPPSAPTDIRLEGAPKPVEVTTDEFSVRLSTTGASIESLALLKHHWNKNEAKPLVLLDSALAADDLGPRRSMVLREFRGGADFEHWPFQLERDDGAFVGTPAARTVVFRARSGDVEVGKAYVFPKAGFDITLHVTVTNRGKEAGDFDYKLLGAAGLNPDEPSSGWMSITAKLAGRNALDADMEFRNVAAGDAPDEKPDRLLLSKNRVEWAALRGRFFSAILAPTDPAGAITAFAEPLDPKVADKKLRNLAVGLKSKSARLEPGGRDSRSFLLRAGPQRAEDLEKYAAPAPGGQGEPVSRNMVAAVDFSYDWFARPARWMLMLLEWSRGLIGNYGWGIILMTLIVKIALHPLQRKGTMLMQSNQEKMQAMAPKLKELQEQYKDDQAKLQQAMMRLYKEEGFHPASMALGCLPMMLQMPVWIALYGAIRGAFGLRQAGFLWIGDLSRPDTLWTMHFGSTEVNLNLLPVLYAGLTAAQSFMTPLPADPQQRQQAWMMRFVPLMFFFIFYSMPSAFVLYFVTNGVLGISETWWIKKQMARAKAREAALAVAAGTAPAATGKDAPKPAPITDPAAFWAQEGEEKRGKGKK
jgi:YidC/Oxa1 family membrane protein insertase